MCRAILDGTLEKAATQPDPVFGMAVPQGCPGVPTEVLSPRQTWADPAAYDAQARKLAGLFAANFTKYASQVSEAVRDAGPRL